MYSGPLGKETSTRQTTAVLFQQKPSQIRLLSWPSVCRRAPFPYVTNVLRRTVKAQECSSYPQKPRGMKPSERKGNSAKQPRTQRNRIKPPFEKTWTTFP